MTVCLYVAIINWQLVQDVAPPSPAHSCDRLLEPPVTTSAGAAGLEGLMEPSSFERVSTVVSVISQDPENQRVLLDGETFDPSLLPDRKRGQR